MHFTGKLLKWISVVCFALIVIDVVEGNLNHSKHLPLRQYRSCCLVFWQNRGAPLFFPRVQQESQAKEELSVELERCVYCMEVERWAINRQSLHLLTVYITASLSPLSSVWGFSWFASSSGFTFPWEELVVVEVKPFLGDLLLLSKTWSRWIRWWSLYERSLCYLSFDGNPLSELLFSPVFDLQLLLLPSSQAFLPLEIRITCVLTRAPPLSLHLQVM